MFLKKQRSLSTRTQAFYVKINAFEHGLLYFLAEWPWASCVLFLGLSCLLEGISLRVVEAAVPSEAPRAQ